MYLLDEIKDDKVIKTFSIVSIKISFSFLGRWKKTTYMVNNNNFLFDIGYTKFIPIIIPVLY